MKNKQNENDRFYDADHRTYTKKIPIARTNYRYVKGTYEINSGELVTVPDDSLSLREIVERFSKNIPFSLQRTGYYDDPDTEYDDIDITRTQNADLVDIMEEKERLMEKERRIKAKKNLLKPPKQPDIQEDVEPKLD